MRKTIRWFEFDQPAILFWRLMKLMLGFYFFAGSSIIPYFYIFMTEHRTIEQQVAYLSL